MLTSLTKFYSDNAQALAPKSSENFNSKLNELAMIGDKYLSYRITCELVKAGLSNSLITISLSNVLSNARMSSLLCDLSLPTSHSSHVNGTLLEGMVGLWVLSGQMPETAPFYGEWSDTFEQLILIFVDMCLSMHKSNSVLSLFNLASPAQEGPQ